MKPRWYDALPGVTGKAPLSDATLAAWPDRAMEDRLHNLSFCPVFLSEIYLLAQHLPMTVLDGPAGPELVMDLRPDRLQRPAFGADNRLILPYRPLVLRMLPFFVETDGEIWRLEDTEGETGPARPLDLQKRLCAILGAQVEGRVRMRTSLSRLIDDGFLIPAGGADEGHAGEFMIDTRALGGQRACEDFLGMRILHAMLFSLNNLKSRVLIPDAEMRARLSLMRDDRLRQRPFLSDDDSIDFDRLFRV